MRYYKIILTPPAGTSYRPITFSSLTATGANNTGALQVDLDIPLAAQGTPQSGAYVRVWGIPLAFISQAYQFTGWDIAIYIGMSKGLPLANPTQQGGIVGKVFECFGTWEGTNQYIDFIFNAYTGYEDDPVNISFNWQKGTPLSLAIYNALTVAFPGVPVFVLNISPNLVTTQTQPGFYGTLKQFSDYILQVSRSIYQSSSLIPYSGVQIIYQNGALVAMDNSVPTGAALGSQSNPKIINFRDLIGQPTWRALNLINFNCVMRGDLAVGDFILLPPVLANSAPQTAARYRNNAVFQGLCQIMGNSTAIRHVGSSRQPQAQSWITTVFAVAQAAAVTPKFSVVSG